MNELDVILQSFLITWRTSLATTCVYVCIYWLQSWLVTSMYTRLVIEATTKLELPSIIKQSAKQSITAPRLELPAMTSNSSFNVSVTTLTDYIESLGVSKLQFFSCLSSPSLANQQIRPDYEKSLENQCDDLDSQIEDW